jgi:hypothetical protein
MVIKDMHPFHLGAMCKISSIKPIFLGLWITFL